MHRYSEFFFGATQYPLKGCNSYYLNYTLRSVMPPEVQWDNLNVVANGVGIPLVFHASLLWVRQNPKLRLPKAKGRAGGSKPGNDAQMDQSVLRTLR